MKKLIIEEVAPGQFILLTPCVVDTEKAHPIGVAVEIGSAYSSPDSLIRKVQDFFKPETLSE